MPYSFSLVKHVLESIGFEFRESDYKLVQYFYNPINGKSIILDNSSELPDGYIREKVKIIDLPYEYFEELSIMFKRT